ncbi:MAG: hypothetical protein QM796_09135 [Chthoniobacteraceae bacterium]
MKDHRIGVETSNVQAVMDGDIDEFIEGKLRGWTAKKGPQSDDDVQARGRGWSLADHGVTRLEPGNEGGNECCY